MVLSDCREPISERSTIGRVPVWYVEPACHLQIPTECSVANTEANLHFAADVMKHVAASDTVAHFTTLSTVDQRGLEPCVHALRVVCGNGGVISRVWRSRGVKQEMHVNNWHFTLGTARRGELGAFVSDASTSLTNHEPADVWHHQHLHLIGWVLQAFAPRLACTVPKRNDSSRIGSSSSSRRSSTSDASRVVTSENNFSHPCWLRLISNECPSFAINGSMGHVVRQRQASSKSSSSANKTAAAAMLVFAHRLNSQCWSAEVHDLELHTQRRTPKSCVNTTTWRPT